MNRQEAQRELLNRLIQTECACRQMGFRLIAGADEAGRGPLAGPVVAACVIMPEDGYVLGVNDSKKLTEEKREELYEKIIKAAIAYRTGIVGQDVIDEINILKATRLAFKQAVESLDTAPDYLYTDRIDKLEVSMPWTPVTKGDATIYSVAAASIIAKVTRDRLMREYDKQYPEYGFAKHKGYGTAEHMEAIRRYGPTPLHRRSFLKSLGAGDE